MGTKEQLNKLQSSFIQFWKAQDKKRRIAYVTVLIAILLIAVIAGILLNKKNYTVLYDGLEASEAAEIVAGIEALGYEATLSSGGRITVPLGTENMLTMEMAKQGYPKSNLGYDMYTTYVDMFSSESQKEEYARIALEERLGAIVSELECVNDAVVTLSIPAESNTVITSLKKHPTASVKISLANDDKKLSNDEIAGITMIIQNAHSGLLPENISIVDNYGIPQIIGEEEIDVVADMTRKFAYKTTLENSIVNKILNLLQPKYKDEVSVAVNMVLDYDSKVSETTDYSPDGNNNTGVLQHADGEDASGGTVVDGGVIGVDPNADDTYPTGDVGGGDTWTQNSFSNTYLVDTYKEQVQKDGYDIESLSVAVSILDDDLASVAEQDDIVRLVANAAGVNPEYAQDLVTVVTFTDSKALEPETPVAPVYLFGLTFDQLILAAAILLILVVILIVSLIIASKSAANKRRQFEQNILESNVFGSEDEDDIVDSFILDVNGQSVEVASLAEEANETKELIIRREIAEFAKTSPEIVAQLLKTWIREEEE